MNELIIGQLRLKMQATARWPIASLVVLLLQFAAPAGQAHADMLPSVAGVVHLDPFTPGPVAAGAVGLAAFGTPGEIIPPGMAGVPWQGPPVFPTLVPPIPGAFDGLVAPGPWAWQEEFDFIGVVGVHSTFFNGVRIPILYGPGTDFVMFVFQPDWAGTTAGLGFVPTTLPGSPALTCVGGPAETGSVCKQTINLLVGTSVAWGTSVTELPFVPGLGGVVFPGPIPPVLPPPPVVPPVLPPFKPIPFFPGPVMKLKEAIVDGERAFFVNSVPEPASLVLICTGMAIAGLVTWRRRKRMWKDAAAQIWLA